AQHALGGRRVGDRQAVVRARRGERIEERAARVAARGAPQLDGRRHRRRGMNRIPMLVANSMPANTPVPIECRLAAPAPLASISGSTPRMNANDVMRM